MSRSSAACRWRQPRSSAHGRVQAAPGTRPILRRHTWATRCVDHLEARAQFDGVAPRSSTLVTDQVARLRAAADALLIADRPARCPCASVPPRAGREQAEPQGDPARSGAGRDGGLGHARVGDAWREGRWAWRGGGPPPRRRPPGGRLSSPVLVIRVQTARSRAAVHDRVLLVPTNDPRTHAPEPSIVARIRTATPRRDPFPPSTQRRERRVGGVA